MREVADAEVDVADPGGLELAWNERVICQTSRGNELGRVVQANHELGEQPEAPLKRVVRRATEVDKETSAANREEARRALRVFRDVVSEQGVVLETDQEVRVDFARMHHSALAQPVQETRRSRRLHRDQQTPGRLGVEQHLADGGAGLRAGRL